MKSCSAEQFSKLFHQQTHLQIMFHWVEKEINLIDK